MLYQCSQVDSGLDCFYIHLSLTFCSESHFWSETRALSLTFRLNASDFH